MPEKNSELKDPREWVKELDIKSTEDIAVPKMLVDQVIGQEQGVEIVRKASEQKNLQGVFLDFLGFYGDLV